MAGRDVAHWRRQPAAVLVGALFPVLLLLMFVYLLGGGMVVPGGGDYRDFLVPGMLALAMVFGVEATMTAVVTDTARGITDRFRSLPMAPSAVVRRPLPGRHAVLGRRAGGAGRRRPGDRLAAGGARLRRWPPSGCCSCSGWRSSGSGSTSGC